MPKGGPNGGNGGKGGEVVLQADENVSDLRTYHFKKQWKAKNGDPGRGSDQNGRGGDSCILKVPLGTEVRDLGTGEIICELLEHQQEVLLQLLNMEEEQESINQLYLMVQEMEQTHHMKDML